MVLDFGPISAAFSFDTKVVFHYILPVKNVTITLDEEVARWARIKAAEQDTSVSGLVGEMLREKMSRERSYHSSMRRFLSRKPRPLSERGTQYPRREEIDER